MTTADWSRLLFRSTGSVRVGRGPRRAMTGSQGLGRGTVAALVAFVLGAGSAAMSAYWALGGTALLDTVGGEIERWGRQRSAAVMLTLWALVVVKLVAAAVPYVLASRRSHDRPALWRSRAVGALGWIVAILLTGYGGLLTGVGVLIQLGVIDAAADVDEHALVWHTYFWDPWFLLWGIASAVAMWRSHGDADMRPHPDARP